MLSGLKVKRSGETEEKEREKEGSRVETPKLTADDILAIDLELSQRLYRENT
jgi:hypothetical protein